MEYRQQWESLAGRAVILRDSLYKSQFVTDKMVENLGSFDHRLSNLESAMRPTQMRTHSIRMAHENIDKTLKSADVILIQLDLSREAEAKILKGPHENLESYLDAVDQLKRIVDFFTSNQSFRSSEVVLGHAKGLLAKASVKIEDEFRQLLSLYSNPVEPERLFECFSNNLHRLQPPSRSYNGSITSPSTEDDTENHAKNLDTEIYKLPTLIPPRMLPLLHDLAQQLVQVGRHQQCSRIYRECRVPVLEKSLRNLGVEKLSREDIQKMQWEDLEAKISNWNDSMHIAVKLLFAGERTVCDKIFEGIHSLREHCFAQVTVNSISILLNCGDAIVKSKRSPEKLFVFLDMYQVLQGLKSEIETIFQGKACLVVQQSASSLTERLAQTAHEIFDDFEEAIKNDSTKIAVHDGTVHPLTSYVINYVKFLFDYQSTLKYLLQDDGSGEKSNSQLASIAMRIMQVLIINLEGKSKQYKDPALTSLFLMNNIHYIVKSVRRSVAKDFLGDDWVQRHRRIVQQNANHCKRVALNKVLQSLSVQGLISSADSTQPEAVGGFSSAVSKTALKERFKSFNTQFEELCQRQSRWTVPDPELRESLKLSVSEILLPAYRSFVRRFGSNTSNRYIKYTPEAVDKILGDFFEGMPQNEQRR
ncbi:Exocyst complex component EXO70A1 [Zostera marina]|uniref:Exocyst subunit Exo70 family protein n=1 Tax=Zostera marina TaxID=29655 RepID=A0A0K9NJQ6_ZOSMR|nr:Exocyst complex component EXO70A1 [Zostera marina]